MKKKSIIEKYNITPHSFFVSVKGTNNSKDNIVIERLKPHKQVVVIPPQKDFVLKENEYLWLNKEDDYDIIELKNNHDLSFIDIESKKGWKVQKEENKFFTKRGVKNET